MRADSRPQPPPARTAGRRRPGRPRYYDPDLLMQVWLVVQEAMAREGLSANRACLTREIRWFVAGGRGAALDHAVRGQTLRSLYQKAARVLRREREERDGFLRALRRAGAGSPQEAEPPPVAAFWEGELRRRLARAG